MFASERWATAFIESAAGTAACKVGLELLCIIKRCIKNTNSSIFGLACAKETDSFLATALKSAAYDDASDAEKDGIEAARALVFILIKRGEFNHLPILIDEIERIASERAGNLDVKVELAAEDAGADIDALKSALKKRYGVLSVNLKQVTTPQLLAGYRLTIGSDMEDYSLAGRLKQLSKFCADKTSQ
jgi:F0F1-type ATP synthase delta subunit